MDVRLARLEDLPEIGRLLYQVNDLHAQGRSDIFIKGQRKYTDMELEEMILSRSMLIYVAYEDGVLGYAFCMLEETDGHHLRPMKTMFIDDLCVDEKRRRGGVGTALYQYVYKEAERFGCNRVTLNVWCLNEKAMAFYRKMGLEPLKVVMEKKL